MNFKLTAIACTSAILALTSCSKTELDHVAAADQANTQRIDVANSGGGCVQLTAGQHINAGSVCINEIDQNNDGSNDAIAIVYNTTGGWTIREIHLWAGTSLNNCPKTNSGNPIPGQFPYSASNINANTYTVTIPFSQLGFDCAIGTANYYVAAHAVVRNGNNTQTAWGQGTRFVPQGNWGMYFDFEISCDEVVGTPVFAFGKNSTCFSALNVNYVAAPQFNNGWTNGMCLPGAYTWTLMMNPTNCAATNAIPVGKVDVNYVGTTATVTYAMVSGYKLSSAAVYTGQQVLPVNSQNNFVITPFAFNNQSGRLPVAASTYTFHLTNLPLGGAYFIPYADVVF